MKLILVAIFYLFLGTVSDSRGNQLVDTTIKLQPDVEVIFVLKLKDQEIITRNLILSIADYKNLDLLSNEAADAKLGKSNKKRVVCVVTPADTVNFLKLGQLLDRYHVAKRFREFQLQIDNRQVLDPKAVIAADNAIYSLNIDKKSKQIIILSKDQERIGKLPKTETGIRIR
jgi:hypothetical protein